MLLVKTILNEHILLERIEKLGQIGDLVAVKAGYARTYYHKVKLYLLLKKTSNFWR